MAITIVQETGTGSASANSYITLSDYEAFLTNRGLSDTTGNEAKKGRIIQSMDWLETLDKRFKGIKKTNTQALLWPRESVVVNNYAVSSTIIPQTLKDAQSQLVYDTATTGIYNVNDGKTVLSEKIGPIEIKYAQTVADIQPIFRKVEEMLGILYKTAGGVSSVTRA